MQLESQIPLVLSLFIIIITVCIYSLLLPINIQISVQVSYNLVPLLLLLLLLFACLTYFIFISSTLVKTVITNPLPSQISAIKGLNKLLRCGVQSDPAIKVQWHWTKDGSDVDASRMQLQNDGTLRIVAVRESDAGTYVCLVKSRGGNATTSGTLSVQGV